MTRNSQSSAARNLKDAKSEVLQCPEIFHVDDTLETVVLNAEKLEIASRAKELCEQRGRLVTVILGKLVQYTREAISRRLFGGLVQEIRFFPEDMLAIVVFALPTDAEGFIRHIKFVKDNDPSAYRALQINAEWYKGVELQAMWPSQPSLVQWILTGATRCLQLFGIDIGQKPDDFAEAVTCGLGIRPIKVAIIHQKKRQVKTAQLGNSGIIEFSSIKDAVESRQKILEKRAPGLNNCRVEFLGDPADNAPVRREYCACQTCNELQDT
ncbi:hypothetical protein L228DRAFT_267395 [Xylona heveae TC161]|uniref:Uncharacterized protein n=1 Tax=Xylona heveae (strain CBS 132557 / TC161) TaxID=1328760 RepID=A0A165HEF6_XYLHT|nr:hypothetical protein L228DRAFT_267395 [Xylona heveae TC161]KZF23388.1 hypothetical protein L228DRAFT_267395 [Xylona heveae TC161]